MINAGIVFIFFLFLKGHTSPDRIEAVGISAIIFSYFYLLNGMLMIICDSLVVLFQVAYAWAYKGNVSFAAVQNTACLI